MGGASLEVKEYSEGDEQGRQRQALSNQRQVEEIHGSLGGKKQAVIRLSGSIRLMTDDQRELLVLPPPG